MRQRTPFFRWFRTIPILSMAFVGALSMGLVNLPSFAPTEMVMHYLFPVQYREEILNSSARYGVDPLLVCSIIKCESGWDAAAESDAGAVGLMQLMPSTSEELANNGIVDGWTYDHTNLTDPATNIEYGCAYLAQLQYQLSSTDEVIAAYNAGPASVKSWLQSSGDLSDVIDFPETAMYLTRVKDSYARYQELYTETLEEREASQ